MKISYIPQRDFPFGNNIHFACLISSGEFLFVHSSLDWIFSGHSAMNIRDLMSLIEAEDLAYLKDVLDQVLTGSFSGKITFKINSLDGSRWLHLTPFLMECENEQIITGSLVDITAETRNINSITKFTDKKNSILHMLGHDLRGPLNIAKSLTKTITRGLDDPILLEKTNHIATILQESIEMISDLVKREFLETVGAELVKKRVDLVKLVKDYLEECKRSENITGINFELTSSSDKVFIKLDNAKFMQVINNLISNSLKFTPTGGTISVHIEDTSDQVNFIFSDTGIGIPENMIPEIFEKFTAARRPGLRGEPTLGLGLSIVKTIVSWHNGRISCQSSEGRGTRFVISLPKNLPG